jgi:Fe-S cluster biogenesis protein NfuA/nitrite reductase/ring-hydroxylating ferredoxin subunit
MVAVDHVARIESLLEGLDALPDSAVRQTATEVVQALLDLYGEGLGRIVDAVATYDDGTLARELGDDELVAHLLLLHGLHPVPVEDRVQDALAGVLPYLESHGGGVELVGVQDGIVRLRMHGSCSGCPSSAMTLKLAIEDAIFRVEGSFAEGDVGSAPALDVLHAGPAPSVTASAWATAGGMPQLAGGGVLLKEISGQTVLFLRPSERIYAYRPACPSCDASLEDAALRATELTCPGCASRYDVLRAGRCLDAPALHLEPVPLLVDPSGIIKVALGAVT